MSYEHPNQGNTAKYRSYCRVCAAIGQAWEETRLCTKCGQTAEPMRDEEVTRATRALFARAGEIEVRARALAEELKIPEASRQAFIISHLSMKCACLEADRDRAERKP